ncbi:MAG: pilus assembly protein [Actinobacteria bacterium]|nr:pilus assembly protein [Actinomycetota bacterium]
MRCAGSTARGRAWSERGAVTAEFAVAMPALLAVLLLALGAVLLAGHRVGLTSAAAELARLEARGDAQAAAARLAEFDGEVAVSRSRAGPLLCLTLRAHPGGGALSVIEISAEGCAAVVEGTP